MALSAPANPAPGKRKKLALLKDMGIGFYDMVGQVVKTFAATYDSMDVYVTDYTTNKNLFMYEDPEADDDFNFGIQTKWPGPFGKMTIMVRLWEPHLSYARANVQEGDFVFLQNIKTKISLTGNLEGALHQDQKYPNKVQIRKCTNTSQLDPLLTRKKAYEDQREQRPVGGKTFLNQPKKPSAKAAAKRKEEKKQRRRLQKELEEQELEKKAEEESVVRAGINPHRNLDKKLSSIAEIIDNTHRMTKTDSGDFSLPFVNAKYRARVRVVDMWPTKLWEFARSIADTQYGRRDLPPQDRERYKDKFEWNFALLVEDANALPGKTPERLMITVGNEQGQCLLKMDACNLSVCVEKRNELEKKMFVLWGNLHERKLALLKEGIALPLSTGDERLQLQNIPFDCCIDEFGEQVGQSPGDPKSWVRRYTLFNTVIMPEDKEGICSYNHDA